MEYRELGSSGVRIPEIGLGTWAYKGGTAPLRRGVELGAFLIDTAESYGTEEAVGRAVRGIRDRVFIATKVSPSHFRRRELLKAAEGSLKRLKIDYIDLYQLHWPNASVPIGETMGTMEELADMGKIRFIGVSNFSAAQLQEAQAAAPAHRIVSNRVSYSLVDRSIEADLLSYCQRNRVTVIAYTPLGRGMSNIKAKDKHGALSRVAAMTGKTEAQVALNWCTAKEGVVAIPKANSVEHVEEDCGASGWRLSDEHMRLLDESFR
jgi:diketogulonate reductase-like aldo/keto reductase